MTKLKIGVAQTINSIDVNKNFESIMGFLQLFKTHSVDLVIFPECSLSGFSSVIKDCSIASLEKYLFQVAEWSGTNGIDVLLPTAFVNDKTYNSGFFFAGEKRNKFYKMGLTESEKQFFTAPDRETKKVFHSKEFRFGVLICMEAEQEPWKYFQKDDVDFIVWPGYWGWEEIDEWSEQKLNKDDNKVFNNMSHWKIPLIQSNFAFNDFTEKSQGPKGLSVVIDHDNNLKYRASFRAEAAFVVTLEKLDDLAVVCEVNSIGP